ncbi:MAG: CsbD family protein [Vagococcus sp.]
MTDNGNTDKLKGTAKEVAGDLTDNKKLKAEGLVDKAVGKVKEVSSDIKDKIDDAKENNDN